MNPRLLDFPSPLGLLRQQEVERGLDDLLGRGARLGVSLTLSRGVELVDELLRNGHMEALQIGGERLEGRSVFRRRRRRRCGGEAFRPVCNRKHG